MSDPILDKIDTFANTDNSHYYYSVVSSCDLLSVLACLACPSCLFGLTAANCWAVAVFSMPPVTWELGYWRSTLLTAATPFPCIFTTKYIQRSLPLLAQYSVETRQPVASAMAA